MQTLRNLRVRRFPSGSDRGSGELRNAVGVGRVDFYHDPAAPPANSIVPSVTVAVRDGAGRILLVHKIDNDYWALPGGAVDLGESAAEAALRETAEETGVTIELTGLVGIYTDPGHVMVVATTMARFDSSSPSASTPL